MKAWELDKNKVYVCNNNKYFIDEDGDLHYKKVLKRNGCESWFLCDLSYNKLKDMAFQETNLPVL